MIIGVTALMQRFKKYILYVLLPLLLNVSLNSVAGAAISRVTEPFTAIETEGGFSLQLKSGPQHIYVDSSQADCVNAYVDAGVLHLEVEDSAAPLASPIHVTVSTPYINSLNLSGNSSLIAHNIRTQGLFINAHNHSYVLLTGYVDVNKIIVDGDSYVSVRWVNSDELTVRARQNGRIFIAGVARVLKARLYDCSHLGARYLRAPTVLVQTWNNSSASVLATYSLSAFANDQSNIYYYKTSPSYLEYTQFSGNVLPMGNWR